MCFDWIQYISFEFSDYEPNSRFTSDSFGFIDYDPVKPAKQQMTAESTEIIPSFFLSCTRAAIQRQYSKSPTKLTKALQQSIKPAEH